MPMSRAVPVWLTGILSGLMYSYARVVEKEDNFGTADTGQQMLTIQQSLDLALQYHSAGRLPEVENVYQQILQADPNQPIAL
jgi:hypothetical protein